MKKHLHSLLAKEWIKIRRGIWIIPLLLGYAAIDSALTLNTIDRIHGAFGLWETLAAKEPQFFNTYRVVIACGVLLGFLQAWPECQGKRLRLLFHMPVQPERIVSVTVFSGLILMVLVNAIALGLLAATMSAFHMPSEMIVPVLLSVIPWSLLSLAAYMGIVAFFGSKGLILKGLVFAACYVAFSMLWGMPGYGLLAPSLWKYALFTAGFLPLVFFIFLRVMGEPESKTLYTVSRGASLLLFTVAMCVVLPDLYWRVSMPQRTFQTLFYSSVEDQFVIMRRYSDKVVGSSRPAGTVYTLEDGTTLNRRDAALALPTHFADNLIKWNIFPESINGVHVSPHQAKYGSQFARFMPRDWNKPPHMLNIMLEANPHGAKLEMPEDIFRIRHNGKGIEFIRPDDGSIDAEKSKLFTAALTDAGFIYPVKVHGGNPTTRKDYDGGYLFIDSEGGVFQLQMINGKPHCVRGKDKVKGNPRAVTVSEHRRKEMIGFIVADTSIYAVMQNDLSLREIPVPDFDADASQFRLWADPLNKYIVSGSFDAPEAGMTGVAMTVDFEKTRSFSQPMLESDRDALERCKTIASALFPVRIVQFTPKTKFVGMNVQYADKPYVAMASGLLFALCMVIGFRMLGWRFRPWDCLLVVVFGPVGLLTVVLTACSGSIKSLSLFKQ